MLPIHALSGVSRATPVQPACIHARFASKTANRTKPNRSRFPQQFLHAAPTPVPTPRPKPKLPVAKRAQSAAERLETIHAIAGPTASSETLRLVGDWMDDAEGTKPRSTPRSFPERMKQQRAIGRAFLTRSSAIADLMQKGDLHPRVATRIALRSFVASLLLASSVVVTGYWIFRRYVPAPVEAVAVEEPGATGKTSVEILAEQRAAKAQK